MPTVTIAAPETVTLLQDIQARFASADASALAEIEAKYAALDDTARAALANVLAKHAVDKAAEIAGAKHLSETFAARLAGSVQFLATNQPVSITLPDDPAPAAA